MPERVRGDAGVDIRKERIFFDSSLNRAGRERRVVIDREVVVMPDKHGGGIVEAFFQIILQRVPRAIREKHNAEFVALAADREFILFQVDFFAFQRTKFSDAQAGGKQQFENGSVAHPDQIIFFLAGSG